MDAVKAKTLGINVLRVFDLFQFIRKLQRHQGAT